MKRILFPTDFSDAANNALNVASDLAKASNAELYVLHALNTARQYVDISLTTSGDITMPGMQPELVLQAIEQEKKQMEGKMSQLASQIRSLGITVYTDMTHQSLATEINNYIERNYIDFVVMGTRGASGLREAFIGTNAQRVVRTARVPVLTVNEKHKGFTIKNIVLSSDFLEESVNRQLPRVKKIANMFEAKLHLLYVNTPTYFEETFEVEQRILKVAKKLGIENAIPHIYNAFDIDEGVISFANHYNMDVIAMVTHGYRGMKKLFSDNVTESVVNHSNVPVLTLHIQ